MYQSKEGLEGNPFSLAGRGQSPAAGVPSAPAALAVSLSSSSILSAQQPS